MRETHYVLEHFYQVYGSRVKEEEKKLLEVYAMRSKGLAVWWRRIWFKEVLRPSVGGRMALRICFLLGKY